MNIHMLNGRALRDSEGEFTFVSHVGKSINDYVLASTRIFPKVSKFEILRKDCSDHFPLIFSINIRDNVTEQNSQPKVTNKCNRLRWNQTKAEEYTNSINATLNENLYETFLELYREGDVNRMVEKINKAITNAAIDNGMVMKKKLWLMVHINDNLYGGIWNVKTVSV
ncbi:hypothetical protein SNE40_015923 [Patella caerulea]|uniref:Uncharacterized protein n=1 Tax=Patella caerulea TaxID=87958 RepID=A0AAN8J8Y3_PATCE